LLDDAFAGPIVRKAAAILRTLRGRVRQRAMLAFRKPEKRAVRICADDKDIYSYTSGVLQNLEAVS
jgi:hypothetical protein